MTQALRLRSSGRNDTTYRTMMMDIDVVSINIQPNRELRRTNLLQLSYAFIHAPPQLCPLGKLILRTSLKHLFFVH